MPDYTLDAPKKKKTPGVDAVDAPATAEPAEQAPAAAPPPQGRAPNPTNFTNFARRFAANADVSKQQANKYAGQAAGKAGAAQASLASAQEQFAQGVNTGSVAPPPGSSAPSATNVGAAVPNVASAPAPAAQPNRSGYQQADEDSMIAVNGFSGPNRRADWIAAGSPDASGKPTQQAKTSSSAELDSESTRPAAPPPATAAAAGPTLEDMLAQAGKQYSGPMGLDTTQATPDAQAAQGQLDALKDPNGIQALVNSSGNSGSQGADALSGALIGSAGRGQFDALRAKFNPNKDLTAAQDKATKTAADAKASSDAAAQGWAKRASDAQSAQDASQPAPTAPAARAPVKIPPAGQESNFLGDVAGDPAATKQRIDEWKQFQEATKTNAGDTFRDVINAASPSQGVSQAVGNRNPLGDYMTGTYHPGSGSASGSTHGDHIPWGEATRTPAEAFWVYRQMTPDQWQEVNSLPHDNQKEWIMKRLQQIRAKQDGQPVPSGNNWPKSGGV